MISQMSICFALMVYIFIVGIAEAKPQITNGEQTDIYKMYESLEKCILALERERSGINMEKSAESRSRVPASSLLLNATNLEERVQALEFHMENVHEDITILNK